MRFLAALMLFPSFVLAADLGASSTVNDFAVQCQHPAMKSNPEQRTKTCVAYINTIKQRLGKSKKTPGCWKSLDNNAAPMAVADAMFYLATQPDDRQASALKSLLEIIVIAAPECK